MAKGGGGSGSAGVGLFASLFVLGLIITYWYVILLVAVWVAAVAGLWFLGEHLWDQHAERRAAAAKEEAALIARADRQHRQVLQGDFRGLYGAYAPPAIFLRDRASDGPAADLRGLTP